MSQEILIWCRPEPSDQVPDSVITWTLALCTFCPVLLFSTTRIHIDGLAAIYPAVVRAVASERNDGWWCGISLARACTDERTVVSHASEYPGICLLEEVVALEHGSARVMHLLVSNDLTVDGMRVEAHPSLVLAEQLDLALYEGGESKPLILSAVVARDDGRSGWWISLVAVTPEVLEHLTRILDCFLPLSRLDMPDPE